MRTKMPDWLYREKCRDASKNFTARPASSPDEFPMQRSLEDQFSGSHGLQEHGRCRRMLLSRKSLTLHYSE
jgi:hypothetical protein